MRGKPGQQRRCLAVLPGCGAGQREPLHDESPDELGQGREDVRPAARGGVQRLVPGPEPGAAAAQPGHDGDQVLQGPGQSAQARDDEGVTGRANRRPRSGGGGRAPLPTVTAPGFVQHAISAFVRDDHEIEFWDEGRRPYQAVLPTALRGRADLEPVQCPARCRQDGSAAAWRPWAARLARPVAVKFGGRGRLGWPVPG